MKRKPDLILVLALVLSLGALVSSYTFGKIEPEQVANEIVIR